MKMLIGAVIGGLIGYIINLITKSSGTGCTITCNPWISTLYGAIIGLLVTM